MRNISTILPAFLIAGASLAAAAPAIAAPRVGDIAAAPSALVRVDGDAGDRYVAREDRGTVVDAPGAYFDTRGGRTVVDAPAAHVNVGRRSIHVEAPFVNLRIPR